MKVVMIPSAASAPMKKPHHRGTEEDEVAQREFSFFARAKKAYFVVFSGSYRKSLCRISRQEFFFFALAKKKNFLSVQPHLPLCLCGEFFHRRRGRRGHRITPAWEVSS